MKRIVEIKYKEDNDKVYYDLKSNKTKKTLKYSKNGKWTNPGEKAYSLENTGNGFIFKDHFLDNSINLDYCQMEALQLLADLTGQVDYKLYKKSKK